MSTMMARPIQYAEKLPATRPDRMFSDAPPCSEDLTTSFTWAECIEVKALTSSGMIAPASVPQVMIVESCHHRSVYTTLLIVNLGMSAIDARYVSTMDTPEVMNTREVSGVSKLNLSEFWNLALANAS